MLLYGLDVNRSSGGNIRNTSFKDWFCVERLKAEYITQLEMFRWFITDSAANDHNLCLFQTSTLKKKNLRKQNIVIWVKVKGQNFTQ